MSDLAGWWQAETARETRSRQIERGVLLVFTCPICSMTAERLARHVRRHKKQGKAGPFCGKRCARRWQIQTFGWTGRGKTRSN